MYYDDEINAVILEEGEDQCFKCRFKTRCPLIDLLYHGGVFLCEEGVVVNGCEFYKGNPLKVVKKQEE